MKKVEGEMGIEPTYGAWKAPVLPLNYSPPTELRFACPSQLLDSEDFLSVPSPNALELFL